MIKKWRNQKKVIFIPCNLGSDSKIYKFFNDHAKHIRKKITTLFSKSNFEGYYKKLYFKHVFI